MRNLLQLLVRYHVLLLFIGLQAVAVWLITSRGYQQARFYSLTRQVSGSVYAQRAQLLSYFQLEERADSLARANVRLLNQQLTNKLRRDTTFLIFGDTTMKRRFRYLPARVINNSFINLNNYYTLSKGSEQGLRPLMGVMTDNGVVGVVRGVSPNFATVVTLQHTSFQLSAQVARNGEVGSLRWNGRQEGVLQLNDIPKYVSLEEGWEVHTSPYSQIFPPGLSVGRITSVTLPPGSNFLDVDVEIYASLRNASQVYVIENLMKAEQDSLENANFQ